MVVKYDQKVLENIPEEWAREIRALRDDPRFSHITSPPSYTELWHYSILRRNDTKAPFDEFKDNILKGFYGHVGIDIAFKIPPIESAPVSNRIFVPGFYVPNKATLESFLAERGIPAGPINNVGRLHSMWETFFDSPGQNNYLDDPTITLPKSIVHGETMKGHDGHGSSHFDITEFMQRLGQKYSIPVYSYVKEKAA